MDTHETRLKFIGWLEQEIAEGPRRNPPMPEQQIKIHERQLAQQLGALAVPDLEAPHIDFAYLRSLQTLDDNVFLRKAG